MPPTIWARPKLTAAALADLCINVFVNAADQIYYNFNPQLFWNQNYVVGFYVVSCRYVVC